MSIIGIFLVIGFARVFGAGVAAYFTSTGNGTLTERVQALLTSKELKDFTSTKYGFRATFLGFPVIDHKSVLVGDVSIPITMYSASVDGDRGIRLVVVYDYSVANIAEDKLSLDGGLNRIVQSIQGARLVSSARSQLVGRDAVFGYFTAPLDGEMVDCYVKLIKKGSRAYGVISVGIPEATFNSFANSFHLE